MNRQILASMNEICNELEDLGLYKSATEITEMMVRISQNKTWSWEQLQFGAEYERARNEARAAGLKKDLDPEAFQLVQDYLKDLYKKKQISKIMTPGEIGRWMVKNPVDKNKLRNLMNGEISQLSSTSSPRTKSIFETNPPPGTRVEFDKTENMTDDELVKDYLWLVSKKLEKHDLDGALDWNDKAKEKLSPEAYAKFDKKQEELYTEYSKWEAEHPDQVAMRDQKKSPEISSGTTPVTTPTGNSSGLDRWVNKAENIYKAWSDKNMPENSTAPLLIKDVLDYMMKVKDSLSSDKIADAQAKIDKVQSFINNIRDKKAHSGTVKSYSEMTGFGGKEADPFGKGKRLDQKKLDYLAKQESKSY
jgi:hypothetical protein